MARVRALVAEHAPDVVLLPGDLTHAGHGEEVLVLLSALPIPVLAIPGNMDGPRAVAEIQRRGKLPGREPVMIGDVSFGGPEVRDTCTVLVTHEPPYGTLDEVFSGRHIGSQAVRELLMKFHPRLLTCGHVHESPGVERVGKTVVVNCTMGNDAIGGALIELTSDEVIAHVL